MKKLIVLLALSFLITGCIENSQSTKTTQAVERQQSQYATAQPVPVYDWSLERDLVVQLYNIRNLKALTHSVWRSDRGLIEGDCASIGFGIPYDTSLTNPLMATDENQRGGNEPTLAVIEQAEPNGIFASKNTSATWVMCAGDTGTIEPIYIETKVTVYPYAVRVDYDKNRVTKNGKASVTITR
jgi:hypothetical protein